MRLCGRGSEQIAEAEEGGFGVAGVGEEAEVVFAFVDVEAFDGFALRVEIEEAIPVDALGGGASGGVEHAELEELFARARAAGGAVPGGEAGFGDPDLAGVNEVLDAGEFGG